MSTRTLSSDANREEATATKPFAATTNMQYDESDEEKDLTNLMWLTELRNQSITWPNSINSPLDDDKDATLECASDDIYKNNLQHGNACSSAYKNKPIKTNKRLPQTQPQHSVGTSTNRTKNLAATQQQQMQLKRLTPTERLEIFLNKIKCDLHEYERSAMRYQTDASEKPPFNYSHIIGMAMLENGRVTLQQICAWIEAKFAFFRVRKKWNNSIRHNLSLHHCFRKIDRKKYEKGKGGYWELGVDQKKCDRKRIRNRKTSSQTKTKQLMNRSKIKPTTTTIPTIISCSPLAVANLEYTCRSTDQAEEELLLDDLDVQQNIDVSSCSHQQQQQLPDKGFYLALNSSPNDCHILANNDEFSTLATATVSSNNKQHQQYQLGSIIISTSATDVVAAATKTFNCFISDKASSLQQQNVLYTEDDITPACENVIVSSYFDNSAFEKEFSIDSSDCGIPLSSEHSPRPNVIVEQLEQPSTQMHHTIPSSAPIPATTVTATAAAAVAPIGPNSLTSCEYASINDSFRPYIDGIEEAFQYLRSMENNREDLLDNLLDISVSDY